MNLKRRGFLSGIAALTATTPEKVLKVAGVSSDLGSLGAPTMGLIGSGGVYAGNAVPVDRRTWWLAEKAKLVALKTLRPSWFEAKRRREAYHVDKLDADLAALVSVSPAMKINIQRERNYRENFEREIAYHDWRAEEDAWNS